MKRNDIITLFIFSLMSFSGCNTQQPSSQIEEASIDADTSGIFHIPYISSGPINSPAMILILHGDAPFNNPSYQYLMAKKIAAQNPNSIAVGLLRPGYTDQEGNQSVGTRGEATGDNYTPEVLAAIHELTLELKEKYNPRKIVLAGHSGGAAISANLMAQYPNTYAEAILIACPCDLHEWRAHMKSLQDGAPIWDTPVKSLSPIEIMASIRDTAQIFVIHGVNDEVVPIEIANKYVQQLTLNHKSVVFRTIPEKGHEVAFDPTVFEQVRLLLE